MQKVNWDDSSPFPIEISFEAPLFFCEKRFRVKERNEWLNCWSYCCRMYKCKMFSHGRKKSDGMNS